MSIVYCFSGLARPKPFACVIGKLQLGHLQPCLAPQFAKFLNAQLDKLQVINLCPIQQRLEPSLFAPCHLVKFHADLRHRVYR